MSLTGEDDSITMAHGVAAYQNASLETASNKQTILLLYQEMIVACKRAIKAIQTNDVSAKTTNIGKLQDNIVKLGHGLAVQGDGELEKNLSSLYQYILFASTESNIGNDTKQLHSCLKVLETLYDGWQQGLS